MWRHAHHRKGRLSLPAIRISAATDLGSSNGAPATAHEDSRLSASQPALDALRSYDYSAKSQSQNDYRNPSRSINDGESADVAPTGAHHFDNGSVDSGYRLSNNGNGNGHQKKQLLPPFLENGHGISARQSHTNELFRSLRGEQEVVFDMGEEFRHMASEPFLPEGMVTAIQTSLHDCAEYERQCAQLEHSIEHKILMWSHILEKYEGQDHTATELRELIHSAQTALQTAEPTVTSAEEAAKAAESALDKHERILLKAKEQIEHSRITMAALEERMKAEEVVQKNIETWKHAMLGTGATLVVLFSILIAWLLR